MNFERYDRQTILAGFGIDAQKKLHQAKVLVVGAGGLGVPVLTYLNAMGIGTLGIVDNDVISISNLHRQVLYSEAEVGQSKVGVAITKLRNQNSETVIIAHETFLTQENALNIIADYDLVVDASDNFPTRYLINDACVILKKSFVYGALHGFEGQVSVFNHNDGPTYRCLFPNMPKSDEVPDCNENGVLGILPGIIGNFQALETVKVLTGVGEVLSGKLLLFDGLSNTFQKISFSARPENRELHGLRPCYDFECASVFNIVDAEAFLGLTEFEKLQLIDVRTPKEFDRNHLKIAKNIPLPELDIRQNEINFDEFIYVVCQSGIRSKKAIERLSNARPDAHFINLSGGMNQIKKHGVTN
ncbi:adenylyltransferase and sulfurtransferase [Pricia antarctica]|uniref:Molybdopterin-synthase adenylyltransferase n=1 Tax=Pricia antarctica TaxID=641691 RepID=A0A1G7E647_9FLAO|nr:HesA/MoeB/ThiF family protein [Pricia antarctica]SDE59198.1 adenylyltransferase and sulfurtransferase [Pricia antarctica]